MKGKQGFAILTLVNVVLLLSAASGSVGVGVGGGAAGAGLVCEVLEGVHVGCVC